MSDSFVINITPDPSVNISVANNDPSVSVNATDANSAVSLAASSGPNVSVAGYGVLANHAPTHHSGQKDELNHNLLGGLQGGSSSERYHLTKEQYDSLGGDGSFDFVSLTGNQIVSGVKTFTDTISAPVISGASFTGESIIINSDAFIMNCDLDMNNHSIKNISTNSIKFIGDENFNISSISSSSTPDGSFRIIELNGYVDIRNRLLVKEDMVLEGSLRMPPNHLSIISESDNSDITVLKMLNVAGDTDPVRFNYYGLSATGINKFNQPLFQIRNQWDSNRQRSGDFNISSLGDIGINVNPIRNKDLVTNDVVINTSLSIGTTGVSERLTVSGNIAVSGDINLSGLYISQVTGYLQTQINKLSVNSIAYAIALG